MPKLNFQDVFLEDKAAVLEKIKEDERQIFAISVVIADILMRTNTKSITVNREEFLERLRKNNISEPVELCFKGSGDSVTVSLEEDNGSSNPWR
jgi:hypothetical protein